MQEEKFEFFWKGPLSQWAKSEFVVNDATYSCAEQYMMHMKAIHFGDKETAEKIMEVISPREHQKLGREVSNYNDEDWNMVAKGFVYMGNIAKFTQSEKHRNFLFATAGKTLVEASPIDKKWGIGLEALDDRAQSRDTWLGENWLGEVLTKVREHLMTLEWAI